MAQTVNVNFSMDADLKAEMEKRVPFEAFAEPFYSDSNISYLENVMQDVREGKANFAEHELIESGQSQRTLERKDRPL